MPTKSVNNHKENLQIGTFFFNLERLYYSGSLIRFIELSKRIRKLLIFYVDGRVYKHLFPKNVVFIRVKAPTKIPRIFRCIYLILKSIWLANKIKKLRAFSYIMIILQRHLRSIGPIRLIVHIYPVASAGLNCCKISYLLKTIYIILPATTPSPHRNII